MAGGPNDTKSAHAQEGLTGDRTFSAAGSDTDIISSSARAYTAALNKLLTWNMRRNAVADADDAGDGSIGDAILVDSGPVQIAQ